MSNYPPVRLDDDDPPLAPRRTTAGETAWVLVFVDGLLLGCGALYWLAQGRFFDENVYEAIAGTPWSTISGLFPSVEKVASAAVRLGGVIGLCASMLVMAIAVTGYRRGERWAWYATWALPFYCTLEIATLAAYRALTPTAAAWDLTLLALAVLALAAAYRWFFTPQRSAPDALAN
jgi:hypothetical protein